MLSSEFHVTRSPGQVFSFQGKLVSLNTNKLWYSGNFGADIASDLDK